MSTYILLTKNPTSGEFRPDTGFDSWGELCQGVLDFAEDYQDDYGVLPQYGEDYRTMQECPISAVDMVQAMRDQSVMDQQGAWAEADAKLAERGETA